MGTLANNEINQASREECVWENYFLYFSFKTYGVGTQKNRDGSFEHPKHMFKLMGKKIITILR